MHMNSKRLYLRGLPRGVGEDELYNFLSRYGKITEVKLLPNYAFVQFESEMVASVVLETYQNQPLLGTRVVVEYSHPLRKDMRSVSNSTSSTGTYRNSSGVWNRCCVIVTSIPPGVCWQELKDFGRLSGSMVAFCDLDRNHRGRGFIEYFRREDALTAAQTLNNKCLGGRPVRVGLHEASLRTQECYKSPGKSTRRGRSEEAENLEKFWPMYHAAQSPNVQRYGSTHSRWDRPIDSIPPAIRRGDGLQSHFERITSWAPRRGYKPYRPYDYLDDFYDQGLPHYRGYNATYRADRGAISHNPYQ